MNEPDKAAACRRLMRGRAHVVLATSLAEEPRGQPYASLVALAFDHDASPLLLLSDLAQHSRNIAADPRISLLFEGPRDIDASSGGDPLAAPRLSALGAAARCDDARLLARFLARHPSAETYAGFGDFHLYRATIARGHLVAGFGRISWLDGAELRFTEDAPELATAEAEIVAHMNSDHADALELYAALLHRNGTGWRMTGIDPEGIDLRRDGETARLDFAEHSLGPVFDATGARQTLVSLAAAARRTAMTNL
jgi:heme iron utilization protein